MESIASVVDDITQSFRDSTSLSDLKEKVSIVFCYQCSSFSPMFLPNEGHYQSPAPVTETATEIDEQSAKQNDKKRDLDKSHGETQTRSKKRQNFN
jgi:hypothetical protein